MYLPSAHNNRNKAESRSVFNLLLSYPHNNLYAESGLESIRDSTTSRECAMSLLPLSRQEVTNNRQIKNMAYDTFEFISILLKIPKIISGEGNSLNILQNYNIFQDERTATTKTIRKIIRKTPRTRRLQREIKKISCFFCATVFFIDRSTGDTGEGNVPVSPIQTRI